jgi:hypothetical protein
VKTVFVAYVVAQCRFVIAEGKLCVTIDGHLAPRFLGVLSSLIFYLAYMVLIQHPVILKVGFPAKSRGGAKSR